MRRKLIIFILVLLLLVSAGTALAQTQEFELGWFAVGGGGDSSGGGYDLSATSGQSAAGELSGGGYTLGGGFWGPPQASLTIYLPLVVR
jgi:hypothetical protein